jgi:hypothetical protein
MPQNSRYDEISDAAVSEEEEAYNASILFCGEKKPLPPAVHLTVGLSGWRPVPKCGIERKTQKDNKVMSVLDCDCGSLSTFLLQVPPLLQRA